jgi:hypothetical protein
VTTERRAFLLFMAMLYFGLTVEQALQELARHMEPPTQSVPDRSEPRQWHQLPAQPFPLDPGEPWETEETDPN